MSNKLKQQFITYFLGLAFILAMGHSLEIRNKHYNIAHPNSFVKNELSSLLTTSNKTPYLQPPLKLTSLEKPVIDTIVPEKNVQAAQKLESEPSKISQIESTIAKYQVTAEHLNIRAKADAASEIINVLNKGDFIEVINAANNGWLALEKGGYVNGKYAQLYDDNVYKTKKSAQVKILSVATGKVKEVAKPSSNVKSDSGLREANIKEILKGTSLAGNGLEKAILEVESEFGINAYFTIAVMKLESGNGKSRIAKDKNNLFGLNAKSGDVYNNALSFKTKGDSVRKFGQLISKNYIDKGYTTVEKVSTKYCQANPKWSGDVKSIMKSDYSKL